MIRVLLLIIFNGKSSTLTPSNRSFFSCISRKWPQFPSRPFQKPLENLFLQKIFAFLPDYLFEIFSFDISRIKDFPIFKASDLYRQLPDHKKTSINSRLKSQLLRVSEEFLRSVCFHCIFWYGTFDFITKKCNFLFI